MEAVARLSALFDNDEISRSGQPLGGRLHPRRAPAAGGGGQRLCWRHPGNPRSDSASCALPRSESPSKLFCLILLTAEALPRNGGILPTRGRERPDEGEYPAQYGPAKKEVERDDLEPALMAPHNGQERWQQIDEHKQDCDFRCHGFPPGGRVVRRNCNNSASPGAGRSNSKRPERSAGGR
jgi:hypothetical protein